MDLTQIAMQNYNILECAGKGELFEDFGMLSNESQRWCAPA
jgi:hypothetical protein